MCPWAIWSDKVCQGRSSALSDLHPFQMRFCKSPGCRRGECSYCSISRSACLTCRLIASGSSGLEWIEKEVMFSDEFNLSKKKGEETPFFHCLYHSELEKLNSGKGTVSVLESKKEK